jgi:hypothetical protein
MPGMPQHIETSGARKAAPVLIICAGVPFRALHGGRVARGLHRQLTEVHLTSG